MASELKVNKISPESGTTLTLGDSGDTINFGSGVLPNFENLTVTGDLTVDTNSLKVDSTNNFVGIGTASPSVALDVVGAITATGNITGTLATASQPNITSVGTLSSLSVSGNITGTLATAAQPNITSLGTLTGLTTTGNINLGDSDRLRLGASQDLQIFHDGSHSNIIDNGSGNLRLGGDTQIYLGRFSGDTPSEAYATFNSNGAVNLYYDNAVKLSTTSTGIDVTGTVVSDGLTVDGNATVSGNLTVDTNTFFIDSVNNIVRIGDNSSYTPNTSADDLIVGTTTSGSKTGITILSSNDVAFSRGSIYFADSAADSVGRIEYNHGTSDTDVMKFFTNTTEAMRITSAGRVGIGTTSPTNELMVAGGTDTRITIDGSSSSGLYITDSGASGVTIRNTNDGDLEFLGVSGKSFVFNQASVNTDFRIESDANANMFFVDASTNRVGIGTNSPSSLLDLVFSSTNTSPTPGNSTLRIRQTASGTNGYFSAINLSTATVGDSADSLIVNYGITNGQSALAFFTDNLNTCSERMRIDQNGRVGIGTTSPESTLHVQGSEIKAKNSTSAFVTIEAGSASYQSILQFSDGGASGALIYDHPSNYLATKVNGSEAMRISNSGNVGIGITSPGVALDVSGAIRATGDITAFYTSDRSLKTNIENISDPINKVKELNGVSYNWTEAAQKKYSHLNDQKEIGVIAQDVEKVLPEMVAQREDGTKAVRYERMCALLIECVKDLQNQIDELKDK